MSHRAPGWGNPRGSDPREELGGFAGLGQRPRRLPRKWGEPLNMPWGARLGDFRGGDMREGPPGLTGFGPAIQPTSEEVAGGSDFWATP